MVKLVVYLFLWAMYTFDSRTLSVTEYSLATIFYSASFMCDLIELSYKGENTFYRCTAKFFILLGALVLYPTTLSIFGKAINNMYLEYSLADRVFYQITPANHVWFTAIFPFTLFLFMIKDRKQGA